MPQHIVVPENARRQDLPPGGAQPNSTPAPPRPRGPPNSTMGPSRGRGVYRGQRQYTYNPVRGRGQYGRGRGQMNRSRGQGRGTRGRGRGQQNEMFRLGRTLQQVIRGILPDNY